MLLRTGGLAAFTLAFAGLCGALAGDYPDKPITLVAPYSAGGASDLAARSLASAVPRHLSQPVLVVNRTGQGGVTGSTFVNRSHPDGYTLLLARVGSQSVAPAMKSNLPYAYDDFSMIGVLELNPVVCATATSKPFATLDDVISKVKASPGELSYSSAGIGSLLHIAVPFVLDTMGVPDAKTAMKHVPYRGGGQATTAAVAGHVDLICTNSSALAEPIAAGTLRPLVVTSAQRIELANQTPTVVELGFPQLQKLVGWSGLFGPPDMPADIVARLRGMLRDVAGDEEWSQRTKELGSQPHILDGPATRAFVAGQYKAFEDLVQKLDMKIE